MKKRILFVTALILTFFLVLSCTTIKVRDYELDTSLLAEKSQIKIVLISDLHSTIFGKDQTTLIELIKKEKPDLIVLSGDIVDDVVPDLGAGLLLSGIKDIAPIYYVTGNHEYWSGNVQNIRKWLQSYQVNILSDTYVPLNINNNEIILAGIEDPDKKLFETPDYNQKIIMESTFRELDEKISYKILIAHRPENIETYKKYSFNLVLSGHTHGGQVRIPYIMNGLYARNQGLFPKYAGGLYQLNNTTLIISRGLSVNFWRPRIFDNPELVVITIESNN